MAGPSEGKAHGIGDQTFALLTSGLQETEQNDEPARKPSRRKHGRPEMNGGPWWIAVPLAILRQFKLLNIIATVFVSVVFLILLMLLATRVFGFRIDAGKMYLGRSTADLGAHATVDATAGFQNTGIWVTKGQKLSLSVEGRIHTAMDHAGNLAKAVKGIIVQKTTQKGFPENVKKRYPMPPLDESAVFYRDWCGPDGENEASDILEDCKLRKELGWGCLLAVVLPNQASARADPYTVLKSNQLSAEDLVPIPSSQVFTADRDGWLTFIINEAVVSPDSPSEDSKIYYNTLKEVSETLNGDPRHRIPLNSIPLIWFADNNGAFRVTIKDEH